MVSVSCRSSFFSMTIVCRLLSIDCGQSVSTVVLKIFGMLAHTSGILASYFTDKMCRANDRTVIRVLFCYTTKKLMTNRPKRS
jgi:hypothetical protein